MGFQNFPAMLTVLLAGWTFTIFLQSRANRRAEALKRKDSLIDRIESLSDWVDGEISKDNYFPSEVEDSYNGMLFQIEVRLVQFNEHVNTEALEPNKLAPLRNIDFHGKEREKLPYQVRRHSFDLVEHIEEACSAIYFGKKQLHRQALDFIKEMQGIILGLIVIIIFLVLCKIIGATFFSN